jgi:hypothetical protein
MEWYHTVNIQWSNKFQCRETVMTTHSTPLHSTTVLVCRMSYIPINVNTKKHKHKHKHIYYVNVNVNVNVNAVKTCVFIPVDACILVLCQKRWNVGILIVYIQCHHATMPPCHYATMPLCHYATMPLCHYATMPLCHEQDTVVQKEDNTK